MTGFRSQVKRILIHPGGALSLQSHRHRAEHWTVVKDTALVTIDGEVRLPSENQSAFAPLGAVYRLKIPGRVPMVVVDRQTGTHLGEDHDVRCDDAYALA